MITKKVTYTDIKGIERTDELFFHLNKIELFRLNEKYSGGIKEAAIRAVNSDNNLAILDIIEDIVSKAYGVATDDGGFVKRLDATEKFVQTEAYSDLIEELLSDPTGMAFVNFFIATLPKALADQVRAEGISI